MFHESSRRERIREQGPVDIYDTAVARIYELPEFERLQKPEDRRAHHDSMRLRILELAESPRFTIFVANGSETLEPFNSIAKGGIALPDLARLFNLPKGSVDPEFREPLLCLSHRDLLKQHFGKPIDIVNFDREDFNITDRAA